MSINFCITFTSIPSRINTVYKTIESIKNQKIKPNKIFLNIPNEYYRFPGVKILDDELNKIKSNLVEISRCNDYGPATKIMGSLEKIKKYDCAIIIDDDHVYDEKFCEILIQEYLKHKKNYTYYTQKIFGLNMAQCADGFLINTKYLDEIQTIYNTYVKNNRNLFLDDDLWISIYLQKIKNAKIENLINKFKEETGKNIVYKIHSSIDALS